jgi:hypothetical protein
MEADRERAEEKAEIERFKKIESKITDELKRKLMEILGERALVSDVRSKDIIEGELIDK